MPYKSPSDFYSWLRFRVPPLKKKTETTGFFSVFLIATETETRIEPGGACAISQYLVALTFTPTCLGNVPTSNEVNTLAGTDLPESIVESFFFFFLLKTGSRLLGVGFAFTTEDLLAPSKAFYHFSFHVYTKKHACMNRQISTQNIRAIHNAPYLANSKDGHLSCSTHLQQQRGHRPPAPSRILLLDTYIFECVLAEIRSNESDWKPK